MSSHLRFRALRIFSGVSQSELAVRVGVHQTFISLLERGERKPSSKTLRKLNKALGKDLSGVFDA